MEVQLEQEELRRRLRAGLELRGLRVGDLAEIVHPNARLGERTLRKLYSGESALTPPICREIAATLGLPYAWFTVPDLAHAIHDEAIEGRVAALEAALEGMRAGRAPAARGRAARFHSPPEAGGSDVEAPANSPRRRSREQRS
jgi:hypothetical protein